MSKDLEFTGPIEAITPTETISYGSEGKSFTKRTLVLSDDDKYNELMVFELGGKSCSHGDGLAVGQVVTVSYSVSCRSYVNKTTGKLGYFTSLRGFRVVAISLPVPPIAPVAANHGIPF